jgi:hypothetical protein
VRFRTLESAFIGDSSPSYLIRASARERNGEEDP